MIILKINLHEKNTEAVHQAVNVLSKGGVIVYPTETAYGLGCDALNREAVKRIFEIKKRAKNLPLPVLVSSIEMARSIAKTTSSSIKLMEKYHPGPLVIALPKKEIIPDEVNEKSIAFRISSNNFAQSIVSQLNRPLISTSANRSKEAAPYSIEDILQTFEEGEIDIIFDAGTIPKHNPSTIIDFTLEPSPQITREGEIPACDIFATLGIPEGSWKAHIKK